MKFFDLTGNRYYMWVVLERSEIRSASGTFWRCQCDCGTVADVRGDALRKGCTTSCGCREVYVDLSGTSFGRLRALYPVRVGEVVWFICECACGNFRAVKRGNLTSGNTQSCGCLKKEAWSRVVAKNTTHGLSSTPEYARHLTALRYTKKKQRTPAWADKEVLRQIYSNVPEGFHVDHIIPLQGELVSGLHVPENLQYLPAAENISKGNKFQPTCK